VYLQLRGGGFAAASRLAAAIGRDKEKFEPWLDSVEAVLRDVYYAQLGAPGAAAAGSEVAELADGVAPESVAAAVAGITELRQALLNNVNRQIALEALYLTRKGSSATRGRSNPFRPVARRRPVV
jgi:hypothetical protein